MKKKLLSLIMVGAMVLSMTACGQSGNTGSGNTGSGASGNGALTGTLKLGVIGPLTGGAAIYGNAVANGAKIAVDEINAEATGFTIELQAQDDEHDAEKSVNAYHQLQDWGVQAIAGTVTTTPCIAVSAEANSDRVFMLTPSASAVAVTEGKDNVFQLCFADPNQGSASAQYIFDNKLATKVAIIYNNADAYSTGIYQTFKAKATELGLEVVSETTFTDDTTDFSVQVGDAQSNGADLVFLPIYYTPASLILQQAASAGYEPKFFGVDGMDGILTIEGFDTSLAEGVMLLTPFSADATDDLTKNFVAKYNENYGEVPSQFAADGYDCAYAIKAALEFYAAKNGGLDVTDMSSADLCEILISVFTDPDFSADGVTGLGMVWDANGQVNKQPKAVVIKDGVYVGM
ncbi:MAG: ABC transporter substrate-binding protein [Lachnospiraceae bacterium]|nr:ABC transporter substrate-binding protein [Lachnospiraceae bacterium]MBO7096149.1 ABC transporter substrate-binding protein [Lachnospiraceae bacterium]MBO7362661.1 ABC transporter substrate-binding protein [Lachnospiraceae bacterium]MBP5702452.1 ABC transporter substrate-binding protein [Lachnospiraceae bacterium]